MSTIVIDTNVYSFMCRGRMDVARLLSEYDEVILPVIALGELEAGFRNGTHYDVNKRGLDRFLSVDRVHVANVDPSVAALYGQIYADLKASGTMIPLNDVWIAATAMVLKSPIVTFDKHFANIIGLNLILLEVD